MAIPDSLTARGLRRDFALQLLSQGKTAREIANEMPVLIQAVTRRAPAQAVPMSRAEADAVIDGVSG